MTQKLLKLWSQKLNKFAHKKLKNPQLLKLRVFIFGLKAVKNKYIYLKQGLKLDRKDFGMLLYNKLRYSETHAEVSQLD